MSRTIAILLVVALVTTVIGVRAQSADQKPPTFEVATIKQNRSGDPGFGGPGDRLQNGQLRLTNRPLRELMREAFQRWQTYEIVGGPPWVDADRWDIVGKTESATDPVMPRLRTLLADRFKLVTHHETRELSIYALVSARADGKLGPSLSPSSQSSGVRIGAGLFRGSAPISMLVEGVLTSAVQRHVVDRTGLSGVYQIELHWTPDSFSSPETGETAPPPPDAPSLFTALQEQLGLKLESTKGPVDVLVIDHVERPTPD